MRKLRRSLQRADERVEKMTGRPGKAGFAVVAAGIALIGRKNRLLAAGIGLIIGGLCLVAYGVMQQFRRSMGMA